MEKHNTGGGFSRPPPTSPRGHRQKKPRREGPSRPHDDDDARWPRLPLPPRSSSGSAESPDGFKPLHLGDYVVQQGPPTTPEFKIRGTSLAAGKAEAEQCGGEPESTSFRGLMSSLNSAADSMFAQVQNIESVVGRWSPTHPIPRAAAGITAQLERLGNVAEAMSAEAEAMAHGLDRSAARQDELERELDDSRGANFKLSCAERDLAEQVHVFKSAAVEAEAELRRLKREVADLGVKHKGIEMDHHRLQEERRKTETAMLRLEDTIRQQEGEIKKAGVEKRKLQTLVQEKDDEVEGLKLGNRLLQNLIQQRVAEAEGASVKNSQLWALLHEKEAQISTLTAGPITPLSSFAPLAGSHSPGPVLPQPPTPCPGSPLPYIKQEPPDHTPSGVYPREPALAEQPQDPTQQLRHLGTGAATILSQLFHITQPNTASNTAALSNFLSHLGAAPEDAPDPRPTTYRPSGGGPDKPWHLQPPWLPIHTAPPTLPPTLEAQFAHLCLLFPFSLPGTLTPTDPETFSLLAALLASLVRADHAAAPRAGWAFWNAMEALTLGAEEQQRQRQQGQRQEREGVSGGGGRGSEGQGGGGGQETRTLLLTVMLGVLCRRLEEGFAASLLLSYQGQGQHAPGARARRRWDLAAFLGSELGAAVGEGPIGGLGAALWGGRVGGAAGAVIVCKMLGGCGDRFCFVETTGVGDRGDDGSSGEVAATSSYGGGEWGMGLLHCGGESGEFLMVDFQERAIRVVDCRLARMRPNAAEPRKLDLIVAREGVGTAGREEEELFRVTAAPRDVAAFWVRYAMGD